MYNWSMQEPSVLQNNSLFIPVCTSIYAYCTFLLTPRISLDIFVQRVSISFRDTFLGSSSKTALTVSLQESILARFTAVSEGARDLNSAFLLALATARAYALFIRSEE